MVRNKAGGEVSLSNHERTTIKEVQAAIAREMGAQSEVPQEMPPRIAELMRELDRHLRNANQEAR